MLSLLSAMRVRVDDAPARLRRYARQYAFADDDEDPADCPLPPLRYSCASCSTKVRAILTCRCVPRRRLAQKREGRAKRNAAIGALLASGIVAAVAAAVRPPTAPP